MAELYMIKFKGSRREYFYNTYYHSLKTMDYVIVQAEQGEDLGILSKKIETDIEFSGTDRPRSILRKAGADDRTHHMELRRREVEYRAEFARQVRKHGLVMKVVDVEYQFDGSKITFYFTADHRVDFRALVRDLASLYKTRIELRQIGVRDEAQRIGGYGICGRIQCCASHIRDFAPVSTQHAREQDLSLNPSKISGNCGRLLCCLRFEAEQYVEVKRCFPAAGTVVDTRKGKGTIERIDVFTEEAIIVNDEREQLRVGANEIISPVGGSRRAKKAKIPDEADEYGDDRDIDELSDDNDQLKELDD